MAGTLEGGRKAAQTNKAKHDAEYKAKYGMGFYQYLGSQGGKKSRGGGFTDRELARRAGKIGGSRSKRGPGRVGGTKSRRGPNKKISMVSSNWDVTRGTTSTVNYHITYGSNPPPPIKPKKHWWSRHDG